MDEKNQYEKNKERLLNIGWIAKFLIIFVFVSGLVIFANHVFKFVDNIKSSFEYSSTNGMKQEKSDSADSLSKAPYTQQNDLQQPETEKSNDNVLYSPPPLLTIIYQGQIIDAETHLPLEGVTVSFGQRQAITDVKGFFQFPSTSEKADEINSIRFYKDQYHYKSDDYIIPSTNILVRLKKVK